MVLATAPRAQSTQAWSVSFAVPARTRGARRFRALASRADLTGPSSITSGRRRGARYQNLHMGANTRRRRVANSVHARLV